MAGESQSFQENPHDALHKLHVLHGTTSPELRSPSWFTNLYPTLLLWNNRASLQITGIQFDFDVDEFLVIHLFRLLEIYRCRSRLRNDL